MAGLAALYGQNPTSLKDLYGLDPKYQLAQQALQSGTSTAPAQGGWGEGLARIFQGAIAGKALGDVKKDAATAETQRQQTLTDALSLGKDLPAEPKQYQDGTSIDWQARPGSQDNMVNALMGNKDTAPIGMGVQGALMDAQIENQQKASEPITPYQKETLRQAQTKIDQGENGITIGPDGTIQIGGSGKGKLTERQGKATSFAGRMDNAEKEIQQLTVKNPNIGANSLTQSVLADSVTNGGITGKLANYKLEPEQRQLVTAQNQWVNGLLRLDSGATLKPEEYSLYRQQYFPQPGDGAEVIAQKAKARGIAKQGTDVEAGPGAGILAIKQQYDAANQPPAAPAGSSTVPQGVVPTTKGQFNAAAAKAAGYTDAEIQQFLQGQ